MDYVGILLPRLVYKAKWVFVGVLVACLCALPSLCSQAQISVSGKLTRKFVVELGHFYEGEIVIANAGDVPTEAAVSQSDYLFFADGRYLYPDPGSVEHSNAPWITLSLFLPASLIVPPGEEVFVHYRIEVPNDPSLAGTYWSMIMVTAAATLPEKVPAEGEVAIHQVVSYGIQIITHIGDTGERKIDILDVKLLREEGIILQIDVENVGERLIGPEVWAELYDEEGTSIGRFEAGRRGIYPGCSVRYRIALSEVPSGEYKALVIFDNNDEYVWGAQYDLEL